jgi:hypothetical protein
VRKETEVMKPLGRTGSLRGTIATNYRGAVEGAAMANFYIAVRMKEIFLTLDVEIGSIKEVLAINTHRFMQRRFELVKEGLGFGESETIVIAKGDKQVVIGSQGYGCHSATV